MFFPDAKTFLSIGPFSIQWYAICIMTGAGIAYYIGQKRFAKKGYDPEILSDYFVALLLLGIIGARIWYVIFMWDELYAANPVDAFKIYNGGLAIHGGIIVGLIYSIWFFKKHDISILNAGDAIMPCVLIAQACGRWGNFFNQEAYGSQVDLSYLQGLHLPQFIIDKMYIGGHYYHPTFLYESIGCILGFLLIVFIVKKFQKKPGLQFASYFIWYGFIRYFIEGLRTDSLYVMGFKTAQLVSIAILVAGIVLAIYTQFFQKENTEE